LWSFNDERVVRAVVGSKAPIITGIGHETDFTLADFAADLRAPTPTAAAELATSITRQELEQQLLNTSHLLSNELKDQIDQRHAVLATALSMLKYNSPLRRLQHERQRLDETYRRVITYQAHRLQLSRTRLVGTKERFEALSPLAVLKRGYAVVMKNELVVSSKKQVSQGDGIKIRLQDGQVGARVTGEG
jgi:exodeoxyribonuclease VII large subunit